MSARGNKLSAIGWFGRVVPGNFDQRSERGVDRGGILENFGDVRFQENQIRALAIGVVVLPTNAYSKNRILHASRPVHRPDS